MINKIILLLALFSLSTSKNNQDQEDEKVIYWSKDRKLKYEDFKEPPDYTETNVMARVGTIIYHDYKIEKDTLFYEVYSCMFKYGSWSKSDDTDIINHEQIHFDIREYYARKTRQHLINTNVKLITPTYVENVFYKYEIKCYELDSIFDKNVYVKHWRDSIKVWKKRLDKMISSLEKYSAPTGKIPLKPNKTK
jgi:hypothetical protein